MRPRDGERQFRRSWIKSINDAKMSPIPFVRLSPIHTTKYIIEQLIFAMIRTSSSSIYSADEQWTLNTYALDFYSRWRFTNSSIAIFSLLLLFLFALSLFSVFIAQLVWKKMFYASGKIMIIIKERRKYPHKHSQIVVSFLTTKDEKKEGIMFSPAAHGQRAEQLQ